MAAKKTLFGELRPHIVGGVGLGLGLLVVTTASTLVSLGAYYSIRGVKKMLASSAEKKALEQQEGTTAEGRPGQFAAAEEAREFAI